MSEGKRRKVGIVGIGFATLGLLAGCASGPFRASQPSESRPGRGEDVVAKERKGLVTMKGNPLTLVGNEVKVGDMAPDFTVLDNALQPVKLSAYAGRAVVLSSVPSLDTPVCDLETRRFNQEAAKLGDQVKVLTISMDLPFAQKRWCGANGIKNVTTLSDYRDAEFGMAYGVLIRELRLLARCVFVVDKAGRVQYVQLVKEVATEPNYDEVLAAIHKLK